jgi:hypothetical protein
MLCGGLRLGEDGIEGRNRLTIFFCPPSLWLNKQFSTSLNFDWEVCAEQKLHKHKHKHKQNGAAVIGSGSV